MMLRRLILKFLVFRVARIYLLLKLCFFRYWVWWVGLGFLGGVECERDSGLSNFLFRLFHEWDGDKNFIREEKGDK